MLDLSGIRRHYEDALNSSNEPGQRVGWRNSSAQTARFDAIVGVLAPINFSSLSDVGCGTGAFLKYLRQSGWAGHYYGTDISPEMIWEASINATKDVRATFHEGTLPPPAEVVVASGIFNVSLGYSDAEWSSYCRDTLSSMWKAASRAVVFNMLSTDSDPNKRQANLSYFEPSEWLTYARSTFSTSIRLDQAYEMYDFTIAIFKR